MDLLARRGERREPRADLARGGNPRDRLGKKSGGRRRRFGEARARAESAVRGEKEGSAPKPPLGRGLNAPVAGSPDALNVAPDSCAERYAIRHCTGRWPPDGGFSVWCFRSRQVSTGRCRDTVPASVSAVWHTHRTGHTEAASGALFGAPLSTFSTKHYVRL